MAFFRVFRQIKGPDADIAHRLLLPLAVLFLSVCLAPAASLQAQGAQKSTADYKRKVDKQFAAWLVTLRSVAEKSGVSAKTFTRAFRGVRIDWSLPELVPPPVAGYALPPAGLLRAEKKKKRQPEFDVPAYYFPERSLNWLVKRGRKNLAEWSSALAGIEKKYGVPKHVVLAIWGRETAFGSYKLRHNVFRALGTEAFLGRRKAFFKKELLIALKILEEGHASRRKMRASWAGAMGHTQFLPSDFMQYAVDYDGDGRRDIWSTIPDALASTANFLRMEGWQKGRTWGYEIRLPKKFDCRVTGPQGGRTIREWQALGVVRSYNQLFPPERLKEPAFLLLPAGTSGPAFLALKNFQVFKEYNPADLYALYVGHLADRIGNNRGFESKWPKVAAFTRDEVRVMQRGLYARGLKVGKIDGLIGSKTRAAIGHFQTSAGQAVTCYPNRKALTLLKIKK